MSLLDAAKALRAAQRNYAADRSEGKAMDVALAASVLDTAISRAELASLSCEPAQAPRSAERTRIYPDVKEGDTYCQGCGIGNNADNGSCYSCGSSRLTVLRSIPSSVAATNDFAAWWDTWAGFKQYHAVDGLTVALAAWNAARSASEPIRTALEGVVAMIERGWIPAEDVDDRTWDAACDEYRKSHAYAQACFALSLSRAAGWCAVPIEPTQAMLDAGNTADLAATTHRSAGLVWAAMLRATEGATKNG